MLMQVLKKRQALPIRSLSLILTLLFQEINFCGYFLWFNFSEHKVINFRKFKRFFISNMFIRITKIWETAKKHGRADICSIDNKISLFRNSYSPGQSKMHIAQRRIEITVKYQRWVVLSK